MASDKDYYDLLGVTRESSAQEIKSAYRKIAVRFHPDRNPGDTAAEERFKEAAEAYSVLSDTDKRERYDRFGHQGLGGGFSGFDPSTFGDFSDILGDLFGFGGGRRRRGGRRAQPGADLRYELRITLEEAAFGDKRVLDIPRLETCEACSGSGSREGGAAAACVTCGGAGQVRFSQGFFTVARTCPQCAGEGVMISDPCADCSGAGRVLKEHHLEVSIPAGVDTGMRLRLVGEGEHGRLGGPPGDLYVDIAVERHERFGRRGADVLSEVVLTYSQAVLGTTIDVETLHGEAPLDIPPGTDFGDEFRLGHQGIPRLDSHNPGDHVVRARIDIPHPRKLKPEMLELLRQVAEVEEVPVKDDKRVIDRVRRFFE